MNGHDCFILLHVVFDSIAMARRTLAISAQGTAARLGAECIGTYWLVFIGPGAVVLDEATGGRLGNLGIGIAFGLAVCTAIYAFGRTSGAHINPAVTLGLAVLGRFPRGLVAPYWAAQLFGATAAGATLVMLPGTSETLGATTPSGSALESLLVETAITFVLMFVIAVVALRANASWIVIAVVVGTTVGTIATLIGPISGASMNPARTFGPAIGSGIFTHHWLYWIGPLVGASIAAIVFGWLASLGQRKAS